MKNEISLDEFVFERLQELENFEKWWRENRKKDPKSFPFSAFRGDWDEQIDLWCKNEWAD